MASAGRSCVKHAVLPGQLVRLVNALGLTLVRTIRLAKLVKASDRPAHFDTINARVCELTFTDDEQVVCFAENFDTIFSAIGS